LTLIFPPWRYHFHVLSRQCFAGYRFILHPPASKSAEEYKEIFAMTENTASMYDLVGSTAITISIDFYNLIMQWLFLLFFIVGVIPFFSDNKFRGIGWLPHSSLQLAPSFYGCYLLFPIVTWRSATALYCHCITIKNRRSLATNRDRKSR